MSTSSFTARVTGFVAGLALAGSATTAGAISLTLPTSLMDANSVFALSADAYYGMAAAGISMSALGNASLVPGATVDGDILPAFNLPVTEVTVNVGLLPPSITPVHGEATGAALSIQRGSNSLALANFVIDYKTEKVLADVIVGGVTTQGMAIYDFDPVSDLKIGLNGLTLNMHQQLNHLMLTTAAQESFTSALKLSKAVAGTLSIIDFGTITIDINGGLRWGLSDKPFTAAMMVPEPGSLPMMFLGLAGIAALARRKFQS